mgnify:CR=1 FL=1
MRRICIAIVLFLCMFAGCASVRTVGTQQIDAVIDSGILDNSNPVTAEDKRLIRSALESARADIVTAETQKVAAEKRADKERKRADSNAAWASRGKWGAGILVGLIVLCIGGAVLKLLGKLPFI